MATPLWPSAVLSPSDRSGGVVVSRYVEHRPGPGWPEAVACTWAGTGGRARSLRVLPDGCTDIAWDGEHLRVAPAVAAPVRHPVGASAVHVGVRLHAAWAGAVLGRPAGEVAPGVRLLDVLDGVDPAPVAAAERALRAEPPLAARHRVLVDLVGQLAGDARPDPRVRQAVDMLAAGSAVADVAPAVGASLRHLRRLFHGHVGVGPKALHRVARFRRFLRLARATGPAGTAPTLAEQAAACGYSDQAHLAHECALLAGVTPRELRGPGGSARPAGRHGRRSPRAGTRRG